MYKIQIEPEVQLDIQDAVKWYNSQQKGLGFMLFLTLIETQKFGKNVHNFSLSHKLPPPTKQITKD